LPELQRLPGCIEHHREHADRIVPTRDLTAR
jgi:hypothetical protein